MVATEKLWTKEQTAAYFDISLRTLQTRVADGDIKAIRLGRRILFDPADVKAAAEAHKTGGTDGIG